MFRKLVDSPWPYFVGAGILVVALVLSQFRIETPGRPVETIDALDGLRSRDDVNVVLIVIDTLRADRLSAYGYERPTSPMLDELARQGIRFDDVTAQSSWTKTSMVSLWTGTYPANHGVLRFNHTIPEEAVMPAEIFRDAGFVTAGIWRNGWVAPNFGFAQGFDQYHKPVAGVERAQIRRQTPGGQGLQGTDEDAIRSAVAFLETFGRERFFLYLHLMDLHQYVYDAESAIFGTSYSDVYDQSINWTDRLIQFLIGHIKEQGLLDETMIVIASDHGEAFMEHGTEGHARNLYGEVTRVPWIIALPFGLETGVVVDAPVANVDLWPTVLDLMGLPPLPGSDGRSLVPLIRAAASGDGRVQDERANFSELDRSWGRPKNASDPLIGVSKGTLRAFARVNNPDVVELYDLVSDPGERDDVASSRPEDAAEMRRLIEEHHQSAKSPWGAAAGEVELDEMKLNQLRALGYVIKP